MGNGGEPALSAKSRRSRMLSRNFSKTCGNICMDDVASEVERQALLGVEMLQDRARGALDFSESSLAAIEEILSEASDFYSGSCLMIKLRPLFSELAATY